ncbi:PWWP domain-containing protein 6-like [Andrographis paniculata]|uniref:PWWP domain-containing protein 6-like n=1 Tax=Andrographis paniculata TaxID=175694 RepID=UPI0021E7AE67|nr:PWWP domain-containing protein 6-like [Andrographis paniculata]
MEAENIGVGSSNNVVVDMVKVHSFAGLNEDIPSCSALVNINEKVKDVEDKGDGNVVKLDDEHGFKVGDFVWAKMKSHPWLPGQIYDPQDASEFALKHGIEGRLLVAFFGDGSCSWCLPNQLKHLVENFKELSVDGSSRSFAIAVKSAVDEVCRVVELKMTCKCLPVEIRDRLAKPVVSNAGVKEGVLAPEVDISRLSVANYSPEDILSKVVLIARGVMVENELEFAVLRSWLSVFYQAKGGYRLPKCCESLHISMGENGEKTDKDSTDFSFTIDVPIQRLENGTVSVLSDDKSSHRRKKRRVSGLVDDNVKVKPMKNQYAVKEGKEVDKDSLKEGSESREVRTGSVLNGGIGNGNCANKGTLSGKREKDEADTSAGAQKLSSTRERKKSKYLSPPYTSPQSQVSKSRISKVDSSESHIKKASGGLSATSPVSEFHVDGILHNASATVNPSPAAKKCKKMSFDESDVVDVPADGLLSELESAALDALYLSRAGSLDMVQAFASAFRSSSYLYGPDYKLFQKCKTNRKRKGSIRNQEAGLEHRNAKSGPKTSKAVKTERKSKISRKASEVSMIRYDEEKRDENASSCLTLTFSPEFPLPSKEHVVKLYRQFGALSVEETTVATDSNSVKIVYMKGSDAEDAFKSSINQRPFGVKNVVDYSLQYTLGGNHLKNPSPCKEVTEKKDCCQVTEEDICWSDVQVIRKKLDGMIRILDNHPKFSPDAESDLKDALKNLLETLETLGVKVVGVLEANSSS